MVNFKAFEKIIFLLVFLLFSFMITIMSFGLLFIPAISGLWGLTDKNDDQPGFIIKRYFDSFKSKFLYKFLFNLITEFFLVIFLINLLAYGKDFIINDGSKLVLIICYIAFIEIILLIPYFIRITNKYRLSFMQSIYYSIVMVNLNIGQSLIILFLIIMCTAFMLGSFILGSIIFVFVWSYFIKEITVGVCNRYFIEKES